MSTASSADKTACLISAIQEILLSEPAGLTSRDIAHRLVLIQAPYSSASSAAFIKRVQRILSMYNSASKTNKGSCFRFNHDVGVWTINKSHSQDSTNFHSGFGPSTPPTKKMPSFQLSRNTSMTTTTMTPTPSTSSLSVISSVVGSSLTTGIMEQVSTWRTGADTDDDDEASLEIYSNPSLNRTSFPSQVSRGESHASGGSLLNGMEIMPTLHQLQFPQHPLDQHDDSGLFHHNSSHSDIMPPPSSTTSGYRRHSVSSHQQRPAFNRMKRPSQDDIAGDQFVPSSNRASYHAMTADILARGVRQTEGRFPGGMTTSIEGPGEQGSTHTPVSKSGFPSPQSTVPSPRVTPVQNFIQQSQSDSVRGDMDTYQRHSSSHSGQLRLSPNQLENTRQRSQSRRSFDGMDEEDEPMQREPVRQPYAPSPRFNREDPRLRDLGATLQKSLSFNGDEEYQEMQPQQHDDEPFSSSQPRHHPGRHHPYLPRPRGVDNGSHRILQERHLQRPQFENFYRDRKGKGRAIEEDREIAGKTPVLLNAINTSQTNVLSELQTAQRLNQDELAHFREELYASLQLAFTRLADQVEGVGRAVVSVENAQREAVQQLGLSIGSAMGDGFAQMTEGIQQQIQQKIQQALQPYQNQAGPRPASIRQASPFPTSHSQSLGPSTVSNSNAHASYGGFASGTGVGGGGRQSFGSIPGARDSGLWRRNDQQQQQQQDLQDNLDDQDEDEDDHGRGKRRAVERPRSTSGSRRTIDRPRRDFEN